MEPFDGVELAKHIASPIPQPSWPRSMDALLRDTTGTHTTEETSLLELFYSHMLPGFLHCAAAGDTFTSYYPDDLVHRLSFEVSLKYKHASKPFQQLAEAFLKLEERHKILINRNCRTAACDLIGRLLFDVRALFFPTPGPYTIPLEHREATQRAILIESGAPIDVEAFMAGNPILRRLRIERRIGYFLSVLLLALILWFVQSFF